MKITLYELLGLIKDNKAPKKIKYNNKIYVYNSKNQDYYYLNDIDDVLFVKLFNYFPTNNFINDYVETIEESKKIEKLPYYSLEKIQKSKNKDEWYENRLELLEKRINDYHNKINELIDEINNLKEK